METFVQEQIEKIAKQIESQKIAVIQSKLIENNIHQSIEELCTGKFKRFMCEKQGGYESYYYDNGTPDGLLIVSFVENIKVSNNNDSVTATINFF